MCKTTKTAVPVEQRSELVSGHADSVLPLFAHVSCTCVVLCTENLPHEN
jgi:hypothetical protein